MSSYQCSVRFKLARPPGEELQSLNVCPDTEMGCSSGKKGASWRLGRVGSPPSPCSGIGQPGPEGIFLTGRQPLVGGAGGRRRSVLTRPPRLCAVGGSAVYLATSHKLPSYRSLASFCSLHRQGQSGVYVCCFRLRLASSIHPSIHSFILRNLEIGTGRLVCNKSASFFSLVRRVLSTWTFFLVSFVACVLAENKRTGATQCNAASPQLQTQCTRTHSFKVNFTCPNLISGYRPTQHILNKRGRPVALTSQIDSTANYTR